MFTWWAGGGESGPVRAPNKARGKDRAVGTGRLQLEREGTEQQRGAQRGPHQVHHVLLVGLCQGSRHEGLPLLLLLAWKLCSMGEQGHEATQSLQHAHHPSESPSHPSAAVPAARHWAPSLCSAPRHWRLWSGGPCSLSEGPLQTWKRAEVAAAHKWPHPTPSTLPRAEKPGDTHCTRSFSSQDVRMRSTRRHCCNSYGKHDGHMGMGTS